MGSKLVRGSFIEVMSNLNLKVNNFMTRTLRENGKIFVWKKGQSVMCRDTRIMGAKKWTFEKRGATHSFFL